MSFKLLHGVYLADTARVMGEVHLGENVSVWYGAAIRGDVARISIGAGSNVQDCAVIHCDSGKPNTIGRRVVIGHSAVVHGAEVGDDTLIGMGAIVLGGAKIGKGCLIAAGCVVPPNSVVPDGMMMVGVPGKVARPVNDREKEYLAWLPGHYMELVKQYVATPEAARFRMWNGNTF
jgi:carbonic anhydrase/acetyltransferase-like protein (isoleucine patch superfamily)